MASLLLCAALATAAGAGCESSSGSSGEGAGEPAQAAPETPPSAEARAEATKIYTSRCSPCHGAEGKGDGATARGLNPQPRNFQDPAWQTKISDRDIDRIIELGGAAVGKSPLMPPNPDLATKQDVIKALRAHIRAMGGHAPPP